MFMNLLAYLETLAPSAHVVEKAFAVLSTLAPHASVFWKTLDTLAALAPDAASVWMLPLAALALAVVHALITRRAEMTIGAALIACFYTAGDLLLPFSEVSNDEQMVLLVSLHTWFTCIAAYIFFVCAVCSLIGHCIGLLWRFYRPKKKVTAFIKTHSKTSRRYKHTPISNDAACMPKKAIRSTGSLIRPAARVQPLAPNAKNR